MATMATVNGRSFEVNKPRPGIYPSLVLVMQAVTRDTKQGLSWELLNTDG